MKFWTGVGSREVPQCFRKYFLEIAKKCAESGLTLRSGYAEGSDILFQKGVARVDPALTQIWMPWKGFYKDRYIPDCKSYVISQKSFEKARDFLLENGIISEQHWGNMSPAARKLHARNFYQIVGKELEPLSEFCVYYAKHSRSGTPVGGTRTAVLLARHFDIPCFKVDSPEDRKELERRLYGL